MNKTWIIAEYQSGLCDTENSNCHLCGSCDEYKVKQELKKIEDA